MKKNERPDFDTWMKENTSDPLFIFFEDMKKYGLLKLRKVVGLGKKSGVEKSERMSEQTNRRARINEARTKSAQKLSRVEKSVSPSSSVFAMELASMCGYSGPLLRCRSAQCGGVCRVILTESRAETVGSFRRVWRKIKSHSSITATQNKCVRAMLVDPALTATEIGVLQTLVSVCGDIKESYSQGTMDELIETFDDYWNAGSFDRFKESDTT